MPAGAVAAASCSPLKRDDDDRFTRRRAPPTAHCRHSRDARADIVMLKGFSRLSFTRSRCSTRLDRLLQGRRFSHERAA